MPTLLETERLLFRPHEPEDLEPFCAMEADPDVRRYVGGAPRTREQAEQKFRNTYLPLPPDQLALWATVYKPDGNYIGYCGVYPHFDTNNHPIPHEGTLAFYLARPYWNRGLATETGHAFLRFGFEPLNLTRIIATVQVGNDASSHVLQKLGFQHISTEHGTHRSYHLYERTRNPTT